MLDEKSRAWSKKKGWTRRGRVQKAMTWLLNEANEENKTLSVTGVKTVSWKREQNDCLHLLTAGPRVSLSVRANGIHRRYVCLIHDYFWRSHSLDYYPAKNSRDYFRLSKQHSW